MAYVTNEAAVLYSTTTSVSGTSAQLFQVNAAGVSAGVAAGNFYLTAGPSNILNGRKFTVTAGGWVKAHGATQTFAPGLQIFPWNTSVAGGPAVSGTVTFTPVASGTLVAGTYYDFIVTQDFFGDANANTLTCFAPSVYVAGSVVSISSTASAITVSFQSASQTEPITGINNTTDYPLGYFGVSFANTVSDTTETAQLTTFNVSLT
jgi:hypothetical protein